MQTNLLAEATITIRADRNQVWKALVDPPSIKKYMFGTTVVSDFRRGSPIIWKGEWQGKSYEDKGTVLRVETGRLIQYTHYSPLSGAPDVPENYHTVTVELSGAGQDTRVTLTQDHNANDQEREHSQKNWEMMLESLKKYVES